MVEMRFHWLNEETKKEGKVKISATTIADCIEVAERELEGVGLVITDYYQI